MNLLSITIGIAMVAAIPSPVSATGAQSQGSTSATQGQPRSGERTRSAPGNISGMDRQFVQKAASGGLMEVELGKIAQQNAASADVKAFGAQMVEDHGKANAELKQIATSAGITLPASMSAEHKSHVDSLRKQQGAAFDRAYVQEMVKDHQKDVEEFEKASQSATSEEIKAFATATLPTLREHLKKIQSIHSAMGGAEGSRQK